MFEPLPPWADYSYYMGFRNMLVEDKIRECLAEVRRGKTEFSVDRGDLTDSEVEKVLAEVNRRAGNDRPGLPHTPLRIFLLRM